MTVDPAGRRLRDKKKFADASSRGGVPVVLVPRPTGDAVLFDASEPSSETLHRALPLVEMLGRLLDRPGVPVRGRLFSIRPQDEAVFGQLKKIAAGDGYIRGTLTDDGLFHHQMAFREVDLTASQAPPAINPMMLAVTAQLAAIQQQLHRIEDTLEGVTVTVEQILEHLHRDQAAQAAINVRTIAEVIATLHRTQRLSEADWDRINGLEQLVRQRLLAVVDEMGEFERKYKPTGALNKDKRLHRRLCGSRWQVLVQQSYALERAGLQWTTAYATKRQQDGEPDAMAVSAAQELFEELACRRDAALQAVLETARNGPKAVARSTWHHLVTTGIPRGRSEDARNLHHLEVFRSQLEATGPFGELRAAPPMLALEVA